ncbi:MAG: outer membrane lipoprotein-sorting protein [Elusimicrobia bacterium]|nr:outer membrane lipoprotein-sorting protein [Elusimicrobiota bacterium]MBD3412306.1 outer membrane lipoprotein-sorting protein [Elusimicrobiota bacterium]
MINRTSIIGAGILMLICAWVSAELSVEEIVKRTNLAAYYAGSDGRSDVTMTITDNLGRERIREFTILRMNIEKGGDQKFYVYFRKPSDVQDMVYMVWKHIDTDDDRWMYLPALDLVKRIAAGDKRSSFVGSDFVYEDVSGRSITEDTHELTNTTETEYVLKNTPKDEKSVEFSYFTLWIDKQSFIPRRAEYYDKQGALYKTVEALEIKEIQGYPTVIVSQATNHDTGSSTKTEFSNIMYNIGLTENIFTERYLRRPPRQWLQ